MSAEHVRGRADTQPQDRDIGSGVGSTALMTAAARAMSTDRQDGLVNDPLAASFVRAAGFPADIPTRSDGDSPRDRLWDGVATYIGIRSRFFDEYVIAAGTGQIVLLASGLDTRAFRLDWPRACTVFELDQPGVHRFKDAVLSDVAATPTCDRRVITTDFRANWVAALRQGGFDPNLPTTWVAEGLLFYLPATTERDLVASVARLSAPGSQFAAEHIGDIRGWTMDSRFTNGERTAGLDIHTMVESAVRPSPAEHLHQQGWTTATVSISDVARRYGRTVDTDAVGLLADYASYITATYA
jgi:methyltransferase (TIGR00027 family)